MMPKLSPRIPTATTNLIIIFQRKREKILILLRLTNLLR
jgi:hypothetical protein